MQFFLPEPRAVFLLFPGFADLDVTAALSRARYLLECGSSGERCLAKLALELSYDQGSLAEALWRLDEPNFQRLLVCLHALRSGS